MDVFRKTDNILVLINSISKNCCNKKV